MHIVENHQYSIISYLDKYIKDVKTHVCDVKTKPSIEKETVATALVNGNNGFGAITGKFCMDLAIKKAKNVGIGLVSAHGIYAFFYFFSFSNLWNTKCK